MNQSEAVREDYVRASTERGLHWRAIQKTGIDRDPEFWRTMDQKHGDVIYFTGKNGCTGVASVEIVDAILRRDNDQMSRGLFLNTPSTRSTETRRTTSARRSSSPGAGNGNRPRGRTFPSAPAGACVSGRAWR